MKKTVFAVLASLVFAGCSTTQNSQYQLPQTMLLAISKTEQKLVMLDPADFKILAKIPVGTDPHEVVTSEDGRFAYVSNTESGTSHEINVIDLVEKKALPSIDTTPLFGPHGLNYNDGKLWFTAEGSKAIGRYNTRLQKLDWAMGTGQNRTHMLDIAHDEKTVYATNVDSGTFSIFHKLLLPPPIPPIGAPLPGAKPRMGWLQTIIESGKGAEGFALTPDGREAWIANAHAATITVVHLSTEKVSDFLDTQTLGISRVAITADSKRALISSLRTGDLLVYDIRQKSKIKTINLGKGAAHILLSPDGKKALVSCTPAGYIAVVDMDKLEMTSKIDIGERPDGMTWAVRRD